MRSCHSQTLKSEEVPIEVGFGGEPRSGRNESRGRHYVVIVGARHRRRDMPPKKKGKEDDGKDAKGAKDAPTKASTAPSASTHFMLLQQCVPGTNLSPKIQSAHSSMSPMKLTQDAPHPTNTGPSTASTS